MSLFYTAYYSCEKVRDFAYDYLDGRLGRVAQFRFTRHLRGCPECQEYIRLYEMAANAEQFRTQNPLPEEFLEQTLAFLDRRGITDSSERT